MNWDKKTISESKHFCVAPWIHVHLWPDGTVYPCCVADSNKPFGTLEKSFNDVLNNDTYKSFRNANKNDEPSATCNKCYAMENNNKSVLSLRKTLNRDYAPLVLDEINKTNDDGSCDEFKMLYWDFRSSNLCNLSCRTCGPQLSSAWAPDSKKLYNARFDKVIKIHTEAKSSLASAVTDQVKRVKEIYFAGGEPLIMPEHLEVLNMLIDIGNTDLHIRYSTNATKLEYKGVKFVELWKKFSRVTVVVSLDEIEDRAEYWRNGTQWNTLLANLVTLSDLAKADKNIYFWFSPTVSCFNAFRLLEMHKFLLDNNLLTPDVEIIYNMLDDPSHFNIKNQTEAMKLFTVSKLLEYIEWLKNDAPKWNINERLIGSVVGMITFIEGGTDQSVQLSVELAKVDKIRNQHINLANPELFELGVDEKTYTDVMNDWVPFG